MRPEKNFSIVVMSKSLFPLILSKNHKKYIIYDMKVVLEPGKYIVAVSGGVDSVVLLHLMSNLLPKSNLIVAHYDHGIRQDSAKDRKFVENLARGYGLEFFYEEGDLGPDTSEALARAKRYEFLKKIKEKTEADAIATAHHKDDLLETVIINLLRGTGRKGLSSLKNRPGLLRPILNYTKKEILDYAKKHELKWQEDETNLDEKYLRNYVRHNLIGKLSEKQKKTLLDITAKTKTINEEMDEIIREYMPAAKKIPRSWLTALSHDIAAEVVADWLRKHGARLDKKTIERLVIQLKTASEGKIIQANKDLQFKVSKGVIRINP